MVFERRITPCSSRVSILESDKFAQYQWICKAHLESWKALLGTVEAAGLARHTGHITAREVTTLSRRYQHGRQAGDDSYRYLHRALYFADFLSGSLPHKFAELHGRHVLTLARQSCHAPQRRFLSPFCRRNDECLRSRLLSTRSLVLEEVGTSSFTLPTGSSYRKIP